MSRVLLLGGTGLLGAPMARTLLATGHEVTILSRGSQELPDGVTGLLADRRNPVSLAAALGGRDFDLTVDLLAYDETDVAHLLGVPDFGCGRYVMISTGQVYLVAAERRPPYVEDDADRPAMAEPPLGTRDWHNWVYGMGKRRAEAAVAQRRGLDATIVRIPVVQGAKDPSRRLWSYLQRMLDGGPVLLPDGGHNRLRFVWTEDVARFVARLAGGLRLPRLAVNLATPDEPTLSELLHAVAQRAGLSPRFVSLPLAEMEAAGIESWSSPYAGAWCSRPDPGYLRDHARFVCADTATWLGPVVAAHLHERAPVDHEGYRFRELERRLVG